MYDDNLFRNIQEEIKHPFHNLLLKKYGIRHKFLTNSEYNHAYDVHQASGERGLEQWVNNRKTDLKKRGVIKESLKKKEQEMKERGYEKQGSTTTKDKEGKPVTYTLFRKGQRRKLLRSWKDKEIHENKEKILNYLATAFHNKSYDYYKKNPKSDQKARFLMLANKYSQKYGDVKKQKYVDRFKRHMAEQNINESLKIEKKNLSWGKMITIHDGNKNSFPLHPEHQEEIKNLRHNDSCAFTDETGRNIIAMRHGDHIHLSSENSNKKIRFHRDELYETYTPVHTAGRGVGSKLRWLAAQKKKREEELKKTQKESAMYDKNPFRLVEYTASDKAAKKKLDDDMLKRRQEQRIAAAKQEHERLSRNREFYREGLKKKGVKRVFAGDDMFANKPGDRWAYKQLKKRGEIKEANDPIDHHVEILTKHWYDDKEFNQHLEKLHNDKTVTNSQLKDIDTRLGKRKLDSHSYISPKASRENIIHAISARRVIHARKVKMDTRAY